MGDWEEILFYSLENGGDAQFLDHFGMLHEGLSPLTILGGMGREMKASIWLNGP